LSDEIDQVAETERSLAVSAAGYLRNPIREPHITCQVCCTPIEATYTYCAACNGLRSTPGIADLVVPLTYGIEGEQSHWLIRHYKDGPNAPVRNRLSIIMNHLLFLGIVLHQSCIEQRVGQAVTLRIAVPSLSHRQGPHPFVQMTTSMHATPAIPVLVPAAGATSSRVFSADQFVLTPEVDLRGQHVLVLDDTWTKGSRTQSAALALRRYGATHVSVLVASRYLRPSYANNADFIRRRLWRDYNPRICPVTGGNCP
jgi:hypothetical protein